MMNPDQIAASVDATADALALNLLPAHRPGVLRYFALAASMAELVQGLPLQPHDDPAEAFVPISPATLRPADVRTGPLRRASDPEDRR
jgi:hypothetical protein